MSIYTLGSSKFIGAPTVRVRRAPWGAVALQRPLRVAATPVQAAHISSRLPHKQNDGRAPARMGRLTIIYKLHRARLIHRRDGRPGTALLCLETKRRRTPPVLRRQHVVDNMFACGPRRDPCVERLRRWFCESLRFKRRQGLARSDGPPEPGQLLSTSPVR